jgi:allantoinase
MPKFDLLIRGGIVVAPQGTIKADIAIAEGKIVELGRDLSGGATETIDAGGFHILPGLIDAHVHFNEPGRTNWEGFATGSAALAAGGGTCFFDMPLNSSPPTLDGDSFDAKRRAGEASSHADFALWGGLTPVNLDKLEELAERGVVGFKAFMCDSGIDDFQYADDLTLRRGMKIAARLGLPVAVHAEDQALTARLTAEANRNGLSGVRDYLASRPIAAEVAAIQRAMELAKEAGCSLHIVHISSVEGIREVTLNKSRLDVSGETCPHYLALTEDDVVQLGASAKCSPPPRSAGERAALWQKVLEGEFELIGSDHSPAPAEMKQSADFFKAWGGIAGVQSTLSLLLTLQSGLSPRTLAKLTAENVARRFKLPGKGRIEIGFDADLALVNVEKKYTLERDHLLDRHRLSPYVGRTLRGVVRRTIVRGRTVFCDGKIAGDFRGRLITPGRAGHA